MINIVTAANERYFPGVVALYKSFLRFCPKYNFLALLQGGADLESKARGLKIPFLMNPVIPAEKFPATAKRPEETAEVHFYRLAVPELSKNDSRSLYLDCDSVILKPLDDLLAVDFLEPVAATRANAALEKQIQGIGGPTGYGFISSLMLFNHAEWFGQGIPAKCFDLMNNQPYYFKTGDQAVLNAALYKNWHELPWVWQPHAGHGTYESNKKDAFVLHFLGTNPWEPLADHLVKPHKLRARKIWQDFYES